MAVLLWHRRGVTGSADVSLARPLRDRFGISALDVPPRGPGAGAGESGGGDTVPGCSHRLVILDEPGDGDSPTNPSGSECGLG